MSLDKDASSDPNLKAVHAGAAVSAVHRGDGGALAESTPNCGLPTSLNRLRGFSPRFINTSEVRVEVPSTDPPARAGFCVP